MSDLKYNTPDSHGDILLPGCFTIEPHKYMLLNHIQSKPTVTLNYAIGQSDQNGMRIVPGEGKCIQCGSTANLGEYYCYACWFNVQQSMDQYNERNKK